MQWTEPKWIRRAIQLRWTLNWLLLKYWKGLTAIIPIHINVEDNISSIGGECGHLRVRSECINCFKRDPPIWSVRSQTIRVRVEARRSQTIRDRNCEHDNVCTKLLMKWLWRFSEACVNFIKCFGPNAPGRTITNTFTQFKSSLKNDKSWALSHISVYFTFVYKFLSWNCNFYSLFSFVTGQFVNQLHFLYWILTLYKYYKMKWNENEWLERNFG